MSSGLTTKCKMGTRSDMAPAIPFKAESSPTPNVAGKWDSVGNKLVYKVYSGIHSTRFVLTDDHPETVFHSSVSLFETVKGFQHAYHTDMLSRILMSRLTSAAYEALSSLVDPTQ
jgi:hypothetical protein